MTLCITFYAAEVAIFLAIYIVAAVLLITIVALSFKREVLLHKRKTPQSSKCVVCSGSGYYRYLGGYTSQEEMVEDCSACVVKSICRAILVPSPFADGKVVMVSSPPPSLISFPRFDSTGLSTINYRKSRNMASNKYGVIKALYVPNSHEDIVKVEQSIEARIQTQERIKKLKRTKC